MVTSTILHTIRSDGRIDREGLSSSVAGRLIAGEVARGSPPRTWNMRLTYKSRRRNRNPAVSFTDQPAINKYQPVQDFTHGIDHYVLVALHPASQGRGSRRIWRPRQVVWLVVVYGCAEIADYVLVLDQDYHSKFLGPRAILARCTVRISDSSSTVIDPRRPLRERRGQGSMFKTRGVEYALAE